MEKTFNLETYKYIYYNPNGYSTSYNTEGLYAVQCWNRKVKS